MSNEWTITVTAVAASLVTGGIALLGQLLTGWQQSSSARQAWERQKISEVYENALEAFDKLRPDGVNRDYAFRDKWHYLLLVHTTWMDSGEHEVLAKKIRTGALTAQDIARIALTDRRLVGGGKRSSCDARKLLPTSS